MSEERRKILQYDARPDLGVVRGSDDGHFVPQDAMIIAQANAFEFGVMVLKRSVGAMESLVGNVRKKMHGSISTRSGEKGIVYESTGSAD